jgi:hypothetical protein
VGLRTARSLVEEQHQDRKTALGNLMPGEVIVRDAKSLITRTEQMQENFAGRRIEVRKLLRRLDQTIVAWEVFEQETWHGAKSKGTDS